MQLKTAQGAGALARAPKIGSMSIPKTFSVATQLVLFALQQNSASWLQSRTRLGRKYQHQKQLFHHFETCCVYEGDVEVVSILPRRNGSTLAQSFKGRSYPTVPGWTQKGRCNRSRALQRHPSELMTLRWSSSVFFFAARVTQQTPATSSSSSQVVIRDDTVHTRTDCTAPAAATEGRI